jgi:hypothetical protein
MSDRSEPQDHRQPATVLTALPPRVGFGHPFARRARARGAKASRLDPTRPVAVTRRGADLDPNASHRLLQPEQSTSTTGGSTDPRSKLVGVAPPACAGLGGELRMGLKPSAMPITGSGWCRATVHLVEPCGPTKRAPVGAEAPSSTSCSTSRGLTGQGLAGFHRSAPPIWRFSRTRRAKRWAPCLFRETATRDESFAPTRSARTPHVARPTAHQRENLAQCGCRRHLAEASWYGASADRTT